LLLVNKAIDVLWIALSADIENEDTIYHALNDLSGLMAKIGEEGGFFHQILEEYF